MTHHSSRKMTGLTKKWKTTGRVPRTTIHPHHPLLRPAGRCESNFPITDCFSFVVLNQVKTVYIGCRPVIHAIEFDPVTGTQDRCEFFDPAPSKISVPWIYDPKPSPTFTLQGFFTPPFLREYIYIYIYIYIFVGHRHRHLSVRNRRANL